VLTGRLPRQLLVGGATTRGGAQTVRIALLHPYSWPTVRRGGERYLHDLGGWLAARGHEVDIVTGAVDDTHEDDVAGPGPRLVRLPLWSPTRLARYDVTPLDTFGASALLHLRRHRYDVVHSLVPSGGIASALTVQASVYTALGHPSPTNRPARRWSRELFARAVHAVRVPAALSASAAEGVAALTGRRPIVLPPGVRTADFVAKLGTGEGPPSLLFNGFADDPRKRLDVLLRALPTVLESLPDIRLALGGGGDPGRALATLDPGVRRDVEAVVDDLGAGTLGDVPDRYRRATVSVLPSVDEAFGLVLVESLACGTPVVCSRSGGMPEIVDDDVGRLAPPDDPAALASAILETVVMTADPDLSRRCTERARRWDWDVVGPLHELAYGRARG
jgi:phosphatidylinositol alpha-mannosyltransferase